MEIREIKVGELVSFVESGEFSRLQPKPITRLRAVSQSKNPHASPDETALIYINEGNRVLAFAGLLPARVAQGGTPVYSNTCWWSDPENGRSLGLPLFYRILEKCNSRLYLSDTTPQTQAILEQTGLFVFQPPKQGIRGFLRFCLAPVFQKRYPSYRFFKTFFTFSDLILNILLSPYRFYFLQKYNRLRYEIEECKIIDAETADFIRDYSQGDLILKNKEKLEWIYNCHWVTADTSEEKYDYPFSHIVTRYELKYYKLILDGKLKAFIAISVRENIGRVPFLFFDGSDAVRIAASLMWIFLKGRINSVALFHPLIVPLLKRGETPFIYRKNITQNTGATKEVINFTGDKVYIQDGDGDVVFT